MNTWSGFLWEQNWTSSTNRRVFVPGLIGLGASSGRQPVGGSYPDVGMAFKQATIYCLPDLAAGIDTLDLTLEMGWTNNADGDVLIHTFTQIDSNNTPEFVILPGGESEANLTTLYNGTQEAAHRGQALIAPFWRFTATISDTGVRTKFYVSLAW